ncbi:unnamed protein product [Effrenium voratum]|nr:unnamed protein product [Effrenium voratum]
MTSLADAAILACSLPDCGASLGLKQPCTLLGSLALQSGSAYLEPHRFQVTAVRRFAMPSSRWPETFGLTCYQLSSQAQLELLLLIQPAAVKSNELAADTPLAAAARAKRWIFFGSIRWTSPIAATALLAFARECLSA